ncbi:methyltransferase [Nonomuraea muscovyensis]
MTEGTIDVHSLRRLAELADYTVPTTIRALAELRVADRLADGDRTVEELAEAVGAHAPSLLRAMRGLAALGVFTEVAPGRFANSDMSDLMRADRPHSLQGCLPLMQADLQAWAALDHTLATGEPAFPRVHGETYYEYLARRPAESARFDASQQGATQLELRAALRGYDWGALGTLVDVGGGNGTFLAGVLQRHPGLRGVLFDLPFVVELSEPVLAEHGVADRCEVVGGSFFDGVPAGHDAYLLKRTLYNWDAESAVRILRSVRQAMRPGSRLLIFEPTSRPGDRFDVARLTDVIMLVFTGGALRTIEQLEALLDEADLRLLRLVPTPMFPILEIDGK